LTDFTDLNQSAWVALLLLLWSVFLLDLWFGDPAYRFHPIRLIGSLLSSLEKWLFAWGWNGYVGGVLLGLMLLGAALGCYFVLQELFSNLRPAFGWGLDLFLGYSLLALRDLEMHGLQVWQATSGGDLQKAREAVAQLVGRDVERLDFAGCNRATLESLGENLSDGVVSPLFWLALGGIPGMLVFKVFSTMDSMVGYQNERYQHFGWFGARTDDLMNWLPARMTWMLLSMSACILPGYDARMAWFIGWSQHKYLPGPNAGWGQATSAGALRVRLVGEKWKNSRLQHNSWLGHPNDSGQVGADAIPQLIRLNRCATLVLLVILSLLIVIFV
jgi:adenosylcobinamide-phosphate synthase